MPDTVFMSNAVPLVAEMQRSNGSSYLQTKHGDGQTVIDQLRQEGAAKVLFPRRQNDAELEAVLINTSGGMTSGDTLEIDYHGRRNTRATLTSQACEKHYRSLAGHASINVRIRLEETAHLNWCPQESIMFNRSQLRRNIIVNMTGTSSFIALEATLFGRVESKEAYSFGRFADNWRIQVDGQMVHSEAVLLNTTEASPIAQKSILGTNTAMATLVAINPAKSLDEQSLTKRAAAFSDVIAGASTWSVAGVKKIVLRLLARDGYDLRRAVGPLFETINAGTRLPRVWNV